MTNSLGWKDLMEEVEKLKKNIDSVSSLTTIEQLYMAKGQLDILNWLLTLREISEKTYEELLNEETI